MERKKWDHRRIERKKQHLFLASSYHKELSNHYHPWRKVTVLHPVLQNLSVYEWDGVRWGMIVNIQNTMAFDLPEVFHLPEVSTLRNMLVSSVLLIFFTWMIYPTIHPDESSIGSKGDVIDERPFIDSADESAVINGDVGEELTTGLGIGDLAPELTLETLDGKEISLSDFKGKHVMISFWATWCPGCRAEIPAKKQLYADLQGEVEILAVNLTESERSESDVEQFVKEQGIAFPVLLDPESEAARAFHVLAVPTSYLIDSSGVIQYKTIGAMSYEAMKGVLSSIE